MCYKIAANFESKFSRMLWIGSSSLIAIGVIYYKYTYKTGYNNNAIEVENSQDSNDADYIPATKESDSFREKNESSGAEEAKDDKKIVTERIFVEVIEEIKDSKSNYKKNYHKKENTKISEVTLVWSGGKWIELPVFHRKKLTGSFIIIRNV